MKVVKKTKKQSKEQVERNRGIAEDKLVHGLSNAEIREKYGELCDSRIYRIVKNYEVVND